MLSLLHMRDFALIDDLSLALFDGLNVLTGETGAGKSILIGAINLILGERSSSEQIRTGADQALVEAVFHCSVENQTVTEQLDKYGIPLSDELIFSRQISRLGRNICRINGHIVPLAALKELGSLLVDLHGQHSQQSLLKTEQQLFLLDEFGGAALANAKNSYIAEYTGLHQLRHKLKSFGTSEGERERAIELLRYQRDEILAASLDGLEEESLRQRLLLLDNMEKLLDMANRAYGEIYEGTHNVIPVLDRLNSISAEITSLHEIDLKLNTFTAVLEEAITGLSELGHEIYSYRDSLAFSPEERDVIEDRLELYRRIKKKYGTSVEEVIAFAEKCEQEIQNIENSTAEALLLQKEALMQKRKMEEQAAMLGSLRKKAASLLEQEIISALKELGMQDARFNVTFKQRDKPDRTGNEEVEFLFSSNRGEPVKSLARIISAGEMARVMLAVKSILAAQDCIPTMIFDEIDSGVGGTTVQKVAEKMARLGLNHQVICVTHSSQIASAANHHYHIFKELSGERTCTRVSYLDDNGRIAEVARLLDGRSEDFVSRQHAAELLTQHRTQDTQQKMKKKESNK